MIVAANRNNVTVHTLDPRQLGEARMISDANEALSADTGGRRIGLTNDFSRPLRGVMADASAYYLLGYESPATAADGKFRKINVDVRRSGVRVIARNGYWAPRPEDLRTSAKASTEPVVPPEVAEALDSLKDQIAAGRRHRLDWPSAAGLRPARSPWSSRRLAARTTPRVGAIDLEVTGADGVRSSPTPLEEPAGVWTVRLHGAAWPASHPGDREERGRRGDRQLVAGRSPCRRKQTASRLGTPVVYRPASVLQYRALMAGTEHTAIGDPAFPAHRPRGRAAGRAAAA